MVEHRPVKAIVAGSSPASGAIENAGPCGRSFQWPSRERNSNRRFGHNEFSQELAPRKRGNVRCRVSGAIGRVMSVRLTFRPISIVR